MGTPDCKEISNANLPTDLAAWARPPIPIAASAKTTNAPSLTPGTPARLTLHPSAGVTLAQPAGKVRTPANVHAGLIRVRIPAAGTWRVSASQPLWIDVLSGSTALPSGKFGALAPCTTIHKVVEFDLNPGDHLIQLSGNPGPDVELMVSEKK
ncbi:hypothetical protein [Polymorphobacter sp.]|uniref:hypothetical protein n=1 Tax=Polymorphobacter sp. TaxID=1909290 RepID=UPI003F712231